jgi:hypothetical protein
MRKLSVPYTIKRNGIYYLNLRWNSPFIRQSLATKDPMEAFQKVNQLAPQGKSFISDVKGSLSHVPEKNCS